MAAVMVLVLKVCMDHFSTTKTHPREGGAVHSFWILCFGLFLWHITEDFYVIFMKYRKARNFIVAHCYGAIHALRLVKKLRDEEETGCVKGLVLISLGTSVQVPSTASLHLKLPTTVMGKLTLLISFAC